MISKYLNYVCQLCICFVIIINFSCAKKEDEVASSTDPAAGGGGGGGSGGSTLFTRADLVKTWTSACISTDTDTITSGNHSQYVLDIAADGSYSYQVIWYSGTCSPVNYLIQYSTAGVLTVGDVVSGSSVTQNLTFTALASDMMAFTTVDQDSVNTACGGTSPFTAGSNNSFNGTHHSTYMMNCMGQTFPNSGNASVNNIGELSSGVLSLGAPYMGIPGVFTGNALPSLVSVVFN